MKKRDEEEKKNILSKQMKDEMDGEGKRIEQHKSF